MEHNPEFQTTYFSIKTLAREMAVKLSENINLSINPKIVSRNYVSLCTKKLPRTLVEVHINIVHSHLFEFKV